jgi:hypothetical protein
MFGHNNTDQISQDQHNDAHVALPDDTFQDLTNTPASGSSVQPASAPQIASDTATPPYLDSPTPQPAVDTESFPVASDELSEPTPPVPTETVTPPAPDSSVNGADLLSIKQEALTSLSPLVHNLELEAEEKFKTLMMLIQASDNHTLVKEAYDAAQAIPDEKVRAQALLDVVNEINYFTHDKEKDNK